MKCQVWHMNELLIAGYQTKEDCSIIRFFISPFILIAVGWIVQHNNNNYSTNSFWCNIYCYIFGSTMFSWYCCTYNRQVQSRGTIILYNGMLQLFFLSHLKHSDLLEGPLFWNVVWSSSLISLSEFLDVWIKRNIQFS